MSCGQRIRHVVAVVQTLLAGYVALGQWRDGHWASVVAAVAFIFAVPPVVAWGKDLTEAWPVKLAAGVLAIAGILSFITEPRAFDNDLVAARLDAGVVMLAADGRCPGQASLLRQAAAACLVQDRLDLLNAAGEGSKVVYLPPTLGLVDQAYSTTTGGPVDHCIKLYRRLRGVCPAALDALPAPSRHTLDQASR